MTTTPCYQCPLCAQYHPTLTGAMVCCEAIIDTVDCVECPGCGEFRPSDCGDCPSCILLFCAETVEAPREEASFNPADYGFQWMERSHRWERSDNDGWLSEVERLNPPEPDDTADMIVRYDNTPIYRGLWPDASDGAVIMRCLGYDRVATNPTEEVAR